MSDQQQILLHTKLHRPRLPHDLVVRPRLVEWLDSGLGYPLTLVCASAGFGKTTLVCSWLEQMEAGQRKKSSSMPAAWLSLDENDSDLTLFLRYFIASLRTIFQDVCAESLTLLQAQQQFPQSVLFATFSNELEQLPGEAILVLDDYHLIHGKEVHDLLNHLVRHWPEKLHLVLISRISPPIPLDSLRAKGMIRDIRTHDLRFTSEEMAAYLGHSKNTLLRQDELDVLEQRFEGWPAGLRLAALSLRSRDNQESVLLAISHENPNIAGYLVEEVLSHQLPAIHTFLLKTSILDRFCTPLCEAVIGEGDPAWTARACLDWIERSELFIISLDDNREWYRYHHLFQELLQQRVPTAMTAEEKNDLHLRASAWFEEHGLINEALKHALAAGDWDLAAHQMNSGLREVLNREDRPTLERWLRLLPEEMIQRNPGLLMIKAWVLQFIWRLDLQIEVIQQVEQLLESEPGASIPAGDLQILRGQIILLKAQLAYFTTRYTQSIDLCQQALALLPASWAFARGSAMLYLGLSMQATGQAQAVENQLLAEYESSSDRTGVYSLILLEALGLIYLWTGQLDRARKMGQLMIEGATHSGIKFSENWGNYFLGMACFQCNELEAASGYFTSIYKNRHIVHFATYRDAVAGLALIHQAKGEALEAWKLVESVSQYDLELSGSEDERTRSLRARLMLLQGDLEGAGLWADTFSGPPPDQPILWLEVPQMTRARILVAREAATNPQPALQILDILGDIASRNHHTPRKIHVLALRALVLDAQGKSREALAVLKQSLDLSRPGGFIRVYVEMGKPMQEMLRRLESKEHSGDAVRRILAHFPGEKKDPAGSKHTARQPPHNNRALVEPLTPRELEILNLLRGPASVKEIAGELKLSPATVKRHINNMYAKLGANKRWKAVARAEELNILPAR